MIFNEKEILSILDPKFIVSWCDLVEDFYDLSNYEKISISNIRYWANYLIKIQKRSEV